MTTITVQHIVRAPHLKKPWLPEFKVVQGIAFVKLSKWDRGFVRYLTARALDLGDKHTYANFAFFDELCSRRDIAFDEALQNIAQQAEADAQEAGQPSRPAKRPRRNMRARHSDAAVLPAMAAIDVPNFPLCSRDDIPDRINVLIDGLRTRTLFAQLEVGVLECIREGCATSSLGRGRRRGKEAGVDDQASSPVESGTTD
jgi:hypothetical protein